jgi:hypothetical protein
MAGKPGIFRIGTGAGFSSDRLDPAVDLAKRGQLDVIVLECLGERTVAFAHRDRMADPRRGYNSLLERRMLALLPPCNAAGTQIITNMGAANPRAAAKHTCDIARKLGLTGLRIACIEGDDVTFSVPNTQPLMDEPGTLADVGRPIVGMNAYLGADAILPAIEAKAGIIIGGRLADPSMYLAPLMHHYGWKSSETALLGAGSLVGHLLECGMQITGGYFADPGVKDVPDLDKCGYPIAEAAADGSAVITKLPGTGGCVTEATVKEQLLYEVHDPGAYLTPDVTADFSRVTIAAIGEDRVEVANAAGRARPEKLKVTVGFDAGFHAEAGVSYAGPFAGERGKLAAAIVSSRLKETHRIKSPHRVDVIGLNSLFVTAGAAQNESRDVRLHVSLRTIDRDEAETMLWEVESLLCCGPAGGGGFRSAITPAVITKSVLIDRTLVKPTIEVFVT